MTEPPVSFDRRTLEAYFDRRPFYVTNALENHPLFELPRLIDLARALPEDHVEFNQGDLPVGAPKQSPRNGLSAEETLWRIAECGSWMVLKHVQRDPAWAQLLDACVGPLEEAARAFVGRTYGRDAFVFISSPHAVTPFHMDPEHNFLLQVRGSKTIYMWGPEDRFVIGERDLETFYAAFETRNLPWDERFAVTAYQLPLVPGQGLHFPATAPHWVKNGPEVSISFSITFRSEATARRERLYRLNARLRRLGLEPTPVGRNVLVDEVKHACATLAHRLRRLLEKKKGPGEPGPSSECRGEDSNLHSLATARP